MLVALIGWEQMRHRAAVTSNEPRNQNKWSFWNSSAEFHKYLFRCPIGARLFPSTYSIEGHLVSYQGPTRLLHWKSTYIYNGKVLSVCHKKSSLPQIPSRWGLRFEHKTCDILAAERLWLMRFNNRFIIDSLKKKSNPERESVVIFYP